jgi:hypothetical protein
MQKCNASGKSRYASEKAANKALNLIKFKNKGVYRNGKRIKRRMGKPGMKRCYYCKLCKGFHLTSMDKPDLYRDKEPIKDRLVFTTYEVLSWKKDSADFNDGHMPASKN